MPTLNEINNIVELINKKSILDARKEAKKLYENYPNNFDAGKLYGYALLITKRFEEAKQIFKTILMKKDDDYDVLNNMGRVCYEIEDFEESEIYLKKALNVNSKGTFTLSNLGTLYLKIGRFDEALKYFMNFFSMVGDLKNFRGGADIKVDFLDTLAALGNKEDIQKNLEIFLRSDFNPNLFFYLMNMNNNYGEEKDHEQILNNYKNKKYFSILEQKENLSPIYFALARFYEKKNPDKAEEYYLEGNKLISISQRFNVMEYQKKIKKIIQNYETCRSNFKVDKNKGKGLIFVIGLPRSGTTLVESIIANNKNVRSGGELLSMINLCERFSSLKDASFQQKDINEIGDTYLKRINFLKKDQNYFLDKLPGNYFYLGLIKLCLPAAKFVLLNREHWDVATSQFRQYYFTNVPFSTKFFNIAIECANFDFIVNYWKKQEEVSESIFTIQYEDLVKNENNIADKLYSFLEFEDKYDPKGRELFFSRTASRFEIQGKIHEKSVRKNLFESLKAQFTDDFNSQCSYWQKFS